MNAVQEIILLCTILGAAGAVLAQTAVPVGPGDAKLPANVYPARAHAVPVEGRDGLQQALDAHRIVRLMPGDYGPGPITLRSGQQLYGLPGTKLSRMIVEPGTTGALVSGVQGNVVFPASDLVSSGNTILRTYGAVIVQGGTLEDNLFVDTRSLDVDVTARRLSAE